MTSRIVAPQILMGMLLLASLACQRPQPRTDVGKTDQQKSVVDQPKPIDKKADRFDETTVAAFRKLGAEYGEWNFRSEFNVARFNASSLPVFRFKEAPKERLPEVAVPFGIDMHLAKVSTAELKVLATQRNLAALRVSGDEITDDALKAMRELNLLHVLDIASAKAGREYEPSRPKSADEVLGLFLGFTKVTDAGLKELAPLKNLERLQLNGQPVSNAGLKELPALKMLADLDLTGTKITNDGLKDLARCESLTALGFNGTGVTDAGLKELAPLKKLKRIMLDDTAVTDEGLKELTRFTEIDELGLANTKITPAGLSELAKFKKLGWISLGPKDIADETLQTLRKIDLLHVIPGVSGKNDTQVKSANEVIELRIRETKLTDVGMKELAHFKNLSKLDISFTAVSNAGIKELQNFKTLTELDLSFTKITNDGMKDLAALEGISILHLGGTDVRAKGLKELAGMKSLSLLYIGNAQLDDAGLKMLRQNNMLHLYAGARGKDGRRAKSAEEIERIDLWLAEFTDAGLKELASLKALMHLELNSTKVTNVGLKELAGFKNLTTLYLRDTQVTDAGVAELQKALPNCKISR
ncbi:MAG: hypothetical protein HY289_09805 [Planctomycetes bacterium]|nr:hypothetical protein [Planctomycetota bacterium]